MLTMEAAAVNDAGPAGLWISLSELARRKGYSKVNAKKIVDRLEGEGLLATRVDGKRRLVNLAEFDHVRGETADPVREAARGAPTSEPAASGTYSKHKAEREGYEAELKRLQLAQAVRELVPAVDVGEASARCAEEVVRVEGRWLHKVDEMAAAVTRDGVHGLRTFVKQFIHEQRHEFAAAFERLAVSETQPSEAAEEEASGG
jgi:hypothetical protein